MHLVRLLTIKKKPKLLCSEDFGKRAVKLETPSINPSESYTSHCEHAVTIETITYFEAALLNCSYKKITQDFLTNRDLFHISSREVSRSSKHTPPL